MKKLLCLLLAMVMCFSLVACSSEEGAGSDSAEEAEKAFTGFMDALCAFDAEAMADYVVDPDAIPEEIKNVNVEAMMATMPEMMAAYEEDLRGVYTALLEKYTAAVSYEKKDSEETDDGYVFTVDMSMPKEDPADSLQNSLTEEAFTELLVEKVTAGELSLDATEEEAMAVIMPAFFDMMNKEIESMEFEIETTEKEIIVSEVDGEWLVDIDANLVA